MYQVKLLLSFSFFLITVFGQAQNSTDEQLAAHYFQTGEYDKAAMYYERLYEKSPSDFYYNYYLRSLIQLEDYKSAQKLVKKQLKRHPTNLKYKIDLGTIYKKEGDDSKADKQFNAAIKELEPSQNQIIHLARAFQAIGEIDFALETYQKGRKLMKGFYPFSMEIAEVYGELGNYEAMIDEYLGLLEINESYIQSVQNILNRNFSFEKGSKQNDLLKQQLLKRVQQQPGKTIYAEMLIWLFIQQKDFDAAFTQSKALDKRQKEDGARLMELAKLCASNGRYDIAEQAYIYVIDKGKDNYYYINGKTDLLHIMSEKIIKTGRYTEEELKEVESRFLITLEELGKSVKTVSIMKELAHLQAYYLHYPEKAIVLLEEIIAMPQIRPQMQAQCKLDLGDILLMKGDVWEASLLYGQVDKAFKYDQLGEQAKFKNAKVHYYTGNFNWAKAQLDVLKGSTSKLIANDALELSLLITDNTGIDTTTRPMLMFARADFLEVQNKDEEALKTLDSINTLYPNHALDDEMLMKRYDISIKRKDDEKAADYLQQIIDYHSFDILADNAVFLLAELYHYRMNDIEKAKELYQKLLTEYPGSLFTVEARKRFRMLRGDNVN